MDPKPQLHHQYASVTNSELSETETKGASPEPPRPFETDGGGEGQTLQSTLTISSQTARTTRRIYDTCLLFGSVIMLLWPWVFWGVVFSKGGVQMNDHTARLARDHPPYVSFVVTLIGNIVALIVSVLFSLTVVRFAQEWISVADKVTVFDVSLLSAFRYQSWPWSLKDLKPIFGRDGWLGVVLVGVCMGAFAFVPSSTTALLAPVPFNKTVMFNGTELDFSSTTSECLQFLNTSRPTNICHWRVISGVGYIDCLDVFQLSDVLESGRVNILSLLPNTSESLTLTQFGNKPGLRFLGPNRGIFPVGPNSPIPLLDTLQRSPISDAHTRAAVLSYNYTLELQGLSSNITCSNDSQSPIKFGSLEDPDTLVVQYNGTCPEGQIDFLKSHTMSVNAFSGLGYWACRSRSDSQREQFYYVYLRGRSGYAQAVGNITCTVPLNLATFPVTYQPQSGVFSVGGPLSTTGATALEVGDLPFKALVSVIRDSQNWLVNMVIQTIATSAIKYFDQTLRDRNLHMYEAMIQGMIEYEITYARFLYSTISNPPVSCLRTVGGTANLQVIGWSAKLIHIGFLMPMTLINLSSLVLLIVVLTMTTGRAYDFDPTEMRQLLAARVSEGQQPGGWDGEIEYLGLHSEPKECVEQVG